IRVHKLQGLTCPFVIFHSNVIPNIAFTYVVLSCIKHRNAIVITQPLTIDKLTATPDKIATFQGEEERVSRAVKRTLEFAKLVVHRMKAVAQPHNSVMHPR
ncbi:hypothetical protein JG687_00017614, partial [Phytophthora cactorum]